MQTEKKKETNNVLQVAALTSAACTVWSLMKSAVVSISGQRLFFKSNTILLQMWEKRGMSNIYNKYNKAYIYSILIQLLRCISNYSN